MSSTKIKCHSCGQSTTGGHCEWCGYPVASHRRGKRGKKFYLVMALMMVLMLSGTGYAYTYTTAGGSIGATADDDIASWATASGQPDWNSLLPSGSSGTETLRPNAAGDKTELSQYPSSGQHWDKVGEATADDDSTYVASNSTNWIKDLYHIDDHSAGSGTVSYVKGYISCRAISTAENTSASVYIKTNGEAYFGTEETVTTSYAVYSYQWDTNPQTGLAWTWDEIDALQIGASLRKANNETKWTRCTQIYAEVNYTTVPPTEGEVPTGDLFEVTPNSNYTGDLQVKVYLTNVAAVTKAYQYLNMKLYLEGSVEAGETPNYQLLTLNNGVAIFNLEDSIGQTHTLSITGGSYSLVSDDSSEWSEGWSVTPEFYCEIAQR